MPYGRGHSRAELRRAAQDIDNDQYVIRADGVEIKATGRRSAELIARKYPGAKITKGR